MYSVICPYCNRYGVLLKDSTEIYGQDFGPLYVCRPCGARVGCHKGTYRPLGTLADAECRDARKEAHSAFDPLWRPGAARLFRTRRRAYAWLAKKMSIPVNSCHIGEFNPGQCAAVMRHCEGLRLDSSPPKKD